MMGQTIESVKSVGFGRPGEKAFEETQDQQKDSLERIANALEYQNAMMRGLMKGILTFYDSAAENPEKLEEMDNPIQAVAMMFEGVRDLV